MPEHELLYFTRGPYDIARSPPPLHQATIRGAGKDITLIAWSRMVEVALAAADLLTQANIEAEVIDLRSLRPFDLATLQASVGRTHRVVVVEEDYRFAGAGAEIAATLAETAYFDLDLPPQRIAAADVPTPYNAQLEQQSIPAPKVVAAEHRHLLRAEFLCSLVLRHTFFVVLRE